jgi:hypothetical protein
LAVRFHDHGVTIRNYWRTRRYRWDQVSHFADADVWASGVRPQWGLDVVLRDGRVVTARATLHEDGRASAEVLAVIERVARKQQMVESAWGAVPGLLPVRFPRPLAEPAVPVSRQRALHGICHSGVVMQ